MKQFAFNVSLRIFAGQVHPVEICSKLGMIPSVKHIDGEQRKTPKGTKLDGNYERHYCCFDMVTNDGEHLPDALGRLADGLQQHKLLFERIRSTGGTVMFYVNWHSPGNTGESLDADLLSKIGQLGIDLGLDVYGSEG